ncbi:MAG: hypothetical protein MMC33_004273 [Icmadophila ericetorum]|nr:hypothetical protein [Icmadophila ericetorum]
MVKYAHEPDNATKAVKEQQTAFLIDASRLFRKRSEEDAVGPTPHFKSLAKPTERMPSALYAGPWQRPARALQEHTGGRYGAQEDGAGQGQALPGGGACPQAGDPLPQVLRGRWAYSSGQAGGVHHWAGALAQEEL